METSWLHKGGRKNLIVFCNGWGMDGRPFAMLESTEHDVLMLYDYRRLDDGVPDLEALAGKYRQLTLVGWSMGVWAGQKLFAAKRQLFAGTMAINGTLCPIDDQLGIPVKLFDATLAGYNAGARLKFYQRMCREKTSLSWFLARQPERSVEDQGEELAALKQMTDCSPAAVSIYEEILVSTSDWIVPTANQRNFWQEKRVTPVSGFHFPFFLWQSWDQLLAYPDTASRQ